MSGRSKNASMVVAAAMVLAGGILLCAGAAERKMAYLGEDFRIGIEGSPGLKFVSGVGFQWYAGLVLKFK
jgi:hypothetical protein